MSEDIDMKSYAGEVSDPAAGDRQFVQPNLEMTHEEALTGYQRPDSQPPAEVQESRQELNFRAMREEIERIKADRESERREYQLQLDLMRANAQRPLEQPQAQQPKQMFEGRDGTDVPSIEEVRREWSARESDYEAKLNRYQGTIEEMHVALNNPDYAEVVQKYAAPLIKNDPILAQGALGAENKAMYVYRLGKMAQQLEQAKMQPTTQVNNNAQRMIENARKPGSLAQAGGQSTLGKADYIASMSDKDFMEYASKHLEGI